MFHDNQDFEDEMRADALAERAAEAAEIEMDNGALCSACGGRVCSFDECKGIPTYCDDCWEVQLNEAN